MLPAYKKRQYNENGRNDDKRDKHRHIRRLIQWEIWYMNVGEHYKREISPIQKSFELVKNKENNKGQDFTYIYRNENWKQTRGRNQSHPNGFLFVKKKGRTVSQKLEG